MRIVLLSLVMLAFAVLEVFIGGARVLYAVPGVCLVALAGLLSFVPRLKLNPRTDVFALVSAFLFAGYILTRNRMSEVDYIARLQFFIMAGCLLIYLLFTLFLTRSEDRMWLLYGLMALALVQVGIGAFQFAENNGWMPLPWAQRCGGGWRASGFFISHTNFAGFLEIIAIMSMSFVIWSRVPIVQRILICYISLCCIAGIVISGCRGGYLSLTLGFCALLLFTLLALKRLRPGRFALIAPICVVIGIIFFAGILLIMFQNQTLWGRVMDIYEPKNMRLFLWSSALDQFHLSPIVGTGGFSFLYYGRLFRDPFVQNDPIHVHNDYLQLLADYGIVGVTLFVILLVAHLVAGRKSFRRLVERAESFGELRSNNLALCIGSLSVIAAYMLHSVVDFNMQLPANALHIAVVFAILANTNPSGSDGSPPPRLITFAGWLLPVMSLAILLYGLPMMPAEYFTERARFALVRQENPGEAFAFAKQGLKTEQKNPDLWYYYGEAALRMAAMNTGDPVALRKESVLGFTKGLEAFPYDSRLAIKLAQAQSESGNYFAASDAITFAEKWDPNSSFVFLYRGIIEHAAGYDAEAESAYKAASGLGGEGGDFARTALARLNNARNPQKAPAPPAESSSPPASEQVPTPAATSPVPEPAPPVSPPQEISVPATPLAVPPAALKTKPSFEPARIKDLNELFR